MNKKTYSAPSMDIIEVHVNQMLASSPTPGFDPNSETGTMGAPAFNIWEE